MCFMRVPVPGAARGAFNRAWGATRCAGEAGVHTRRRTKNMKMTTLAAAMIGLGGAVGAAPARSAVEIYGVLDTAVEHLRSSTRR